jgi:hypothetical protein
MKLDANSLKRPRRESKRFEFEDVSNPGKVWSIHLRKLDPSEEAAASQRAEELTRRYVLGGFLDDRTGGWMKEPLPFHAVDGEAPQLSHALFALMSRIEAAQSGSPGDERYSVEELIGLAVCMPDAWDALRSAFALLQAGADPKAVWTAFMEQPSLQESNSEQAIPPLPSPS